MSSTSLVNVILMSLNDDIWNESRRIYLAFRDLVQDMPDGELKNRGWEILSDFSYLRVDIAVDNISRYDLDLEMRQRHGGH